MPSAIASSASAARAGLGAFDPTQLPAATAIGRCDDARVLQIYWLAAAAPGMPVENPRQVSAYRYPRSLRPAAAELRARDAAADRAPGCRCCCRAPPASSATPRSMPMRCWRSSTRPSPTSTRCSAPRACRSRRCRRVRRGTRLKVYVRDRGDLDAVAAALQARFGDRVPRILLHAAICRRELCVEIDGVHGP